MGIYHSRNYGEPAGVTEQGVEFGKHTPYPHDVVQYTGPGQQCCFVNVKAILSAKGSAFTKSIISTDVDTYYPVLSEPYSNGFILKQFQAIPAVQQQRGIGYNMAVKYQAILSKPFNMGPSQEVWQLRIEKSVLQTQHQLKFFSKSTYEEDTSDLYKKINEMTSNGGRLICVEITGYERRAGQSFAGIKGVDLFFNMPLHREPTLYVYHAISVPIDYKIRFSQISVTTDFMAQFAVFLQKGWKLIEINFDTSLIFMRGFLQRHKSLNSIWFFEKEASKVNSEVPEWEGTIVEYEHKIGTTCRGVKAKTKWDSIIMDMGQRGWELACLVQTPDMYQTGCSTAGIKIIMFFQRRIMHPAWTSL